MVAGDQRLVHMPFVPLGYWSSCAPLVWNQGFPTPLGGLSMSTWYGGRVYCAAVRSVLIYGSETSPLRVEDTRKLLVFDHKRPRNIAGVCWDHRVSNSEVRRRVLGKDGKSVDEVVNLHRLIWLGHVLRMPEHRLPRRAMLTGVRDGWKK
ncbi:unnamed protein product, partial [Schistosoma curassoni]|uniref:HNH endonuclease n=1 Tax=Schistosoma curassoni TaxID=6186 RepID=A0A183L1U1_9TREM